MNESPLPRPRMTECDFRPPSGATRSPRRRAEGPGHGQRGLLAAPGRVHHWATTGPTLTLTNSPTSTFRVSGRPRGATRPVNLTARNAAGRQRVQPTHPFPWAAVGRRGPQSGASRRVGSDPIPCPATVAARSYCFTCQCLPAAAARLSPGSNSLPAV